MISRALILILVSVASIALSACGMTPVYGTYANTGANAPVAAALNSVYIDNIPDRSGQRLRNILTDRLYKNSRPGANAQYRVVVAGVSESIYGLGIAKDATATRSQIKLYTTVYLRSADNSTTYFTRNLKAVSSFNTLASQYTTLVTEEDARVQTIEDLAQQIVTQLELYFTNPGAYQQAAETLAKTELDADGRPVVDRQSVDWTDRESVFKDR